MARGTPVTIKPQRKPITRVMETCSVQNLLQLNEGERKAMLVFLIELLYAESVPFSRSGAFASADVNRWDGVFDGLDETGNR